MNRPRAFLIPTHQRDLHTTLKMLDILRRGGVEIHQANAPFIADGVEYPGDTYVVSMSQPFRAHAKDLLEVQRYPERRPSPESPPEQSLRYSRLDAALTDGGENNRCCASV